MIKVKKQSSKPGEKIFSNNVSDNFIVARIFKNCYNSTIETTQCEGRWATSVPVYCPCCNKLSGLVASSNADMPFRGTTCQKSKIKLPGTRCWQGNLRISESICFLVVFVCFITFPPTPVSEEHLHPLPHKHVFCPQSRAVQASIVIPPPSLTPSTTSFW